MARIGALVVALLVEVICVPIGTEEMCWGALELPEELAPEVDPVARGTRSHAGCVRCGPRGGRRTSADTLSQKVTASARRCPASVVDTPSLRRNRRWWSE
jgi:hypothetical protein